MFFGPLITIALLYPSSLPDGLTFIQWSFIEFHNNDPDLPWVEPESNTDMPPNCKIGVAVFNIIVFVPTETADAVIFCNEDEPWTIRSFAI